MLTFIVVRVIEIFNEKNPGLVAKSFVDCGISIYFNGLENYKIKIKGINWREIDFSGFQTADNDKIIRNYVEPDAPLGEVIINELGVVYDYYTIV